MTTETNPRKVKHDFVPSTVYANYCGVCALSESDHFAVGPDYVDPFDNMIEEEDLVQGTEHHFVVVWDSATDTFSVDEESTEARFPDGTVYVPSSEQWGHAYDMGMEVDQFDQGAMSTLELYFKDIRTGSRR